MNNTSLTTNEARQSLGFPGMKEDKASVAHFGVPGMHWGQRKSSGGGGSSKGSSSAPKSHSLAKKVIGASALAAGGIAVGIALHKHGSKMPAELVKNKNFGEARKILEANRELRLSNISKVYKSSVPGSPKQAQALRAMQVVNAKHRTSLVRMARQSGINPATLRMGSL